MIREEVFDLFGNSNGAEFSDDRVYRYKLWRTWDKSKIILVWVMLNPSTASASIDDATIRKICGFAKRLGAGGIIVVNLFALRATDPKELGKHHDPIGPDNDRVIQEVCEQAQGDIIVAWGSNLMAPTRAIEVAKLITKPIKALKQTDDGSPGHPLYIKNTAQPVLWRPT